MRVEPWSWEVSSDSSMLVGEGVKVSQAEVSRFCSQNEEWKWEEGRSNSKLSVEKGSDKKFEHKISVQGKGAEWDSSGREKLEEKWRGIGWKSGFARGDSEVNSGPKWNTVSSTLLSKGGSFSLLSSYW